MTSSRALALLAACAGPVFMVAAAAGWLTGHWPADPATFALSAVVVVGGPLLGVVHAATALVRVPAAPPRPAAPPPRPEPPLPPRLAAARAFHHWRDAPAALDSTG